MILSELLGRVLPAVFLFCVLGNVGCSSADGPPPSSGVMMNELAGETLGPAEESTRCEQGAERYCTVRHQFSAVVWCLDGSQVCEAGVWSACEAEQDAEAYEELEGLGGAASEH